MKSQDKAAAIFPGEKVKEIRTLVDLLRFRAQKQPDNLAYTFLLDGEQAEAQITYSDLDRQARMIAARLHREGAVGRTALLVYNAGLEYIAAFFGCLYAGVIAVPVYPIGAGKQRRTLARFLTIAEDAEARIALTTSSALAKVGGRLSQTDNLPIKWISTDDLPLSLAEDWQSPDIEPETLAFLQYTSGSTAMPKGVMVSHSNLLHNERVIQTLCEHDSNSRFVGWLPLYHDMGLIGNVLQPLYIGAPCVLMSPSAFLQKPIRWLEAISRYQAHTSGGPNFAYELCVRTISPEQIQSLDLSSWKIAFNGAEPVRQETLRRFEEKFGGCGFRAEAFYPCYGLAEATLMVTGSQKRLVPQVKRLKLSALRQHLVVETDLTSGEQWRAVVSCGRSLPEQEVIIVDPESLTPCSPGRIGEIWVRGSSVANGYWRKTETTEAIFRAQTPRNSAGFFLRTGDLGFCDGDELYVTGRLKDSIVIRGQNHYPEDLELTVGNCDTRLRPGGCAAFLAESSGEERLVVACEVDRIEQAEMESLTEAIRRAISEEHELQACAVLLLPKGGIPKTTSGKLQRHKCAELFHDGGLGEIWRSVVGAEFQKNGTAEAADASDAARLRQVTESLLQHTAKVLAVEPSELDPTRALTNFGLDSLGAVQIRNYIETEFGLLLSGATLLEGASLRSLTEQIIAGVEPERHAKLEPESPASGGDECPLSQNQRSLWFMHQVAPSSAAYHIARAVRIQSELDVPALKRVFAALLERHETLRTVFTMVDGQPSQRALPFLTPDFREEQATNWSEAELNERLEEEARQPFDLDRPALLRVRLFVRGERDYVLLLTMHHIVTDLWSLGVMLQELAVLYSAEVAGRKAVLPPPAAQYSDYARWQAEMLASPEGDRLQGYWLKQLRGAPQTLALPTDRPRPAMPSYRGAALPLLIDQDLTDKIKAASEAHGATLFMTMLASLAALLHRWTSQSEILLGAPSSGRSRAQFERAIGYFVNPLVYRINVADNPSFGELLNRVRDLVLNAYRHEDYPFSLLVEQLQPERDLSRSPIFQSMFVWQRSHLPGQENLAAFALGHPGARLRLADLEIEAIPLRHHSAQLDLRLMMAEYEGTLAGHLEYNTDIFVEETATRLLSHFRNILRSGLSDPDAKISRLELLDSSERHQLIYEWNDTRRDYPRELCIHQMFEAQAELDPDAAAVVAADGSTCYSYRQINEQANRIAYQLRSLGVRPGVLVGMYLDRCPEVVAALLGILKAGGAYVPVEPTLPTARTQFIFDSLGVCHIVTKQAQIACIKEALPGVPTLKHLVCLDEPRPEVANALSPLQIWTAKEIEAQSAANLEPLASSDDLAYIIFTSGSTGAPKGVVVQHRPVINLIDWVNRSFQVGAGDRMLWVSSICFDLSVYDIFGILAAGGSIRVATDADLQNPERLLEILLNEPITFWDSAPAALQQLVPFMPADPYPSQLRLVFLSGDWIPLKLPDRIRSTFSRAAVIALGGATEAAVWSNFYPAETVDSNWPSIPYGKPIQNARYHILDRELNPCPVGVAGDLYIGGECLSCGYAGEAILTAEKYIPDLFGSTSGARLYRTGDLARYHSDGNIEFLGRVDHQVKIRGYRVELGEIESVLTAHPSVGTCAVITQEKNRDKRLIAYVTPRNGRVDVADLETYLKQRLPAYMTPSAFVQLKSLPVTSNGKLDRAALSRLEATDRIAEFQGPRTPIEAALAAIWAEVLDVKKISIDDNFFALGGHSLLMTQTVARVRKQFQVDLPIADFFQAPTVARLAVKILEAQAAKQGSATIETLVENLERMTEDEIAALLQDQTRSVDAGCAAGEITVSETQPEVRLEASDFFRIADFDHAPCGQGLEAVYAGKRGHLLPSATVDLLRGCQTMRTLDDHVAALSVSRSVNEVREELERLARAGLLISRRASIEALRRVAAKSDSAIRINTVGYLTCNRLNLLERGLSSYIENALDQGRSTGFVVMDDSADLEARNETRRRLANLHEKYNVQISYAGLEEKSEFASLLASVCDVSLDVVRFAIFGEALGRTTAGANRNSLSLDCVGEAFISVDDDTVCQIGVAPEATDGVAFVSRDHPVSVYPRPDRVSAADALRMVKEDFIALHERLLGRDARALARETKIDAVDISEASAEFLRRLESDPQTIMVTLNGYIGDCGWGSPGNFLFLTGASLDRLVRSESDYRIACTSREMVQVVNQLTISDKAGLIMMAFAGLDNRDLLPPFLPVGRAQDNLFGATISACFRDACVGHLPQALLHLPAEPRFFSPGEVTRNASGIDLATLIGVCIKSFGGPQPSSRRAALRSLGRYMEEIGRLPIPEFQEFIRARLWQAAAEIIERLEREVRERDAQPPYWASDVRRFIDLLRRSLIRPEYLTPLDLLYGRSLEQAAEMSRALVRRFGEVLSAWPTMNDAARELRARGIRVSRPV